MRGVDWRRSRFLFGLYREGRHGPNGQRLGLHRRFGSFDALRFGLERRRLRLDQRRRGFDPRRLVVDRCRSHVERRLDIVGLGRGDGFFDRDQERGDFERGGRDGPGRRRSDVFSGR
jgi:hypothetical protein